MSALGLHSNFLRQQRNQPSIRRLGGKKHLWPDAAYLRPDDPATGKTRSGNGQAKRLITR
jgi:hypothetical protein